MKKFLIGAMALGCAVCCLALASGCKNEGSFSAQSYSCAGEEVRNVSVDVRDSAVEIAPSEDGTLRIEYYESESRTYGIALEGGTLSVSLVSEGGIGNFFGVQPDVGFRTLRLYVPDGLGTLAVTTTNEDIPLASVSCTDSVSLNANGGDIRFTELFAGEIGLTAKNGSITGSIAGGWDDFSIRCTVKKGDCNLPEQKEGGRNTLLVDCNNGDVAIDLKK